jgi:signal transduction histidine kinase
MNPDGGIIADSQGTLAGQNLIDKARLIEETGSIIRGSLRPSGTLQRWLFVARPLPSTTDNWLVVAELGSRLPLFQLFGENLSPPLAQAALLSFVLSILLAWLISRSVARPIQRAALAARAIAGGNYDQQLEPGGPVEIQELTESFNQMVQQVKLTRQAQRDLLANVSHDLKTPLTSIQGFSQAILDGTAASPDETQRAARVIHDEAGRMRRMIDDLLFLARIDAGQIELLWGPVNLTKLLQSCITRFEPYGQTAQVSLNLQVPGTGLMITGDSDRLVQLFSNLLDNAIKHTPPGGRVTVSAENRGETIVVSVTDTGPGIPAGQLKRIFERFYQVDASRDRSRSGGVGLGLAISKELAKAHHGSIHAESVVGVGTKFSISFPSANSAPTLMHKRK